MCLPARWPGRGHRQNRPGRSVFAEFIGDQRQVDRAVSADAAAAARFINQQHGPAELRSFGPVASIETGWMLAVLSQLAERRPVGEKPRGGVAEHILIGG